MKMATIHQKIIELLFIAIMKIAAMAKKLMELLLIPNCRDNIYAIAVAVAAHHMNVTNSLLV
jgi:hypothetical protein